MVQIPSASLMHAGRPPRLCLGVIKLASNIFCRGFWSHPMGHDSCTDSGGRGKKKLKIEFGGGKLRSGIETVDFSTLPFPSFRSTLRLCCDHRNFITASLPSHSSPLSPLNQRISRFLLQLADGFTSGEQNPPGARGALGAPGKSASLGVTV